jgi:hypothetical protein
MGQFVLHQRMVDHVQIGEARLSAHLGFLNWRCVWRLNLHAGQEAASIILHRRNFAKL